MIETTCQLTDFQILLVSSIPGMGRKTISKLIQHISFSPSSTTDLLEALIESQDKIPRLSVPDLNTIKDAEDKANKILSITNNDIMVLGPANPLFPKKLRLIPDPPVLIYAKGNLEPVNQKICVAVIGTREPSKYGLRWAQRVGSYLAKKDIIVVSGLALGCDAAGHEGCLEQKGYTLAVLANGLDKIYPASNRHLGERILESGGCLLSEYPPGISPRKNFFVERNRLQSGLSLGVIIVETDLKGGTMHTANFALTQGRKLACLKHPEKHAETPKSLGNTSLISEGKAFPISSEDDLLSFLSSLDENLPNSVRSIQDNKITSDDPIHVKLPHTKPPEQITLFKD